MGNALLVAAALLLMAIAMTVGRLSWRRRRDPNALGHRRDDPRCRGGQWHPPRETTPESGAQIRGRPWRGARYSDDTPKESTR